MLFSLISKEFSQGSISKKFKRGNILNAILEIIVYAAFIVIECFLYYKLNDKLKTYVDVPILVLILFLAIVNIGVIVFLTGITRSTIFNEVDNFILITKPITPLANVISKVIFVYLRGVIFNYLLSFPILVIYAVTSKETALTISLLLLYPLIVSLFEAGIAYLLCVPFQYIYLFLKKYVIAQIITSIILIVGLCYAYSIILNLFMVLVKEGNIATIFTKQTISIIDNLDNFFIFDKLFVEVFNHNYLYILLDILIGIVSLALGIFVISSVYLHFVRNERESSSNRTTKFPHVSKPIMALVKKEFKLIFASNSIFSFSGLLIMQPILTFFIIKAMNVIFSSGILTFVSAAFPFMIAIIQITFIVLFAEFINTSSSFIITREGYNGIKICKTIPINYKTQVIIKMFVPFICSIMSILISLILLVSFKQITISTALLAFILAIVLVVLLEMISVSGDFKKPSLEDDSNSNNAIIEIIAILAPMLSVLLIFVLAYLGLGFIISFIIAFALLLAASILYGLYFTKNINKMFINLETRN